MIQNFTKKKNAKTSPSSSKLWKSDANS